MKIKKNLFFCFFPVAIIILIISSCSNSIKNVQQSETENKFYCDFHEKKRNFFLFLPETINDSTSLVIMLPGYGSNAQNFISQTHFEKNALLRNYGVLYLTGIPNPKMKGSSEGWNYFYNKDGKNDLNYILAISKYVQKKYNINGHLFVVGFSNGAFMTSKLASEKSDMFKAAVSVGGMMPDCVWNHRKTTKAGFFQINGTKDEVTPMKLNDSAKYNPNPAMEDVIDFFVTSQKISAIPVEENINEKVKITKYGNQVWWMLIKDYPHSWPGERTCKININEIILDFFDLNS